MVTDSYVENTVVNSKARATLQLTLVKRLRQRLAFSKKFAHSIVYGYFRAQHNLLGKISVVL